jgi:hypothetical protein
MRDGDDLLQATGTGGINQTYIPLYFFSGGTVMDEMKESGGGFYFFWFWWVNSHLTL